MHHLHVAHLNLQFNELQLGSIRIFNYRIYLWKLYSFVILLSQCAIYTCRKHSTQATDRVVFFCLYLHGFSILQKTRKTLAFANIWSLVYQIKVISWVSLKISVTLMFKTCTFFLRRNPIQKGRGCLVSPEALPLRRV